MEDKKENNPQIVYIEKPENCRKRINSFIIGVLGLIMILYFIFHSKKDNIINYEFLCLNMFLMILLPGMVSFFFKLEFDIDQNLSKKNSWLTTLNEIKNINKPENKELKSGLIKLIIYWIVTTLLLYIWIEIRNQRSWAPEVLITSALMIVLAIGSICQSFIKALPK